MNCAHLWRIGLSRGRNELRPYIICVESRNRLLNYNARLLSDRREKQAGYLGGGLNLWHMAYMW